MKTIKIQKNIPNEIDEIENNLEKNEYIDYIDQYIQVAIVYQDNKLGTPLEVCIEMDSDSNIERFEPYGEYEIMKTDYSFDKESKLIDRFLDSPMIWSKYNIFQYVFDMDINSNSRFIIDIDDYLDYTDITEEDLNGVVENNKISFVIFYEYAEIGVETE